VRRPEPPSRGGSTEDTQKSKGKNRPLQKKEVTTPNRRNTGGSLSLEKARDWNRRPGSGKKKEGRGGFFDLGRRERKDQGTKKKRQTEVWTAGGSRGCGSRGRSTSARGIRGLGRENWGIQTNVTFQ